MRSLVLSFLIRSACGGLAALGAWAASAVLRRLHTPARLLCWLWMAVGLRFLLPWGIPVTLPRPQNAQLAQAADTVQRLTDAPVAALPVPNAAAAAPAAESAAPWYAGITVWHILFTVWAVGALVLIGRAVWGYFALRRRVAAAYKTDDGCYTGDCVPAPFTLGFVRPRVYLPEALRGTVRESVLLHERTHIRRHDPLTKPLYYLACCLHWFNPLAWLAFRRFEREMESACDEAAVRGRPAAERNAYCEALLQYALHGKTGYAAPGCLAFGQGSAKERIVHLLHYRRLGAGALLACVLAVGVCTTACMMRPTLDDAAPTTEADALSAEVLSPAAAATPETAQADDASAAVPALQGTLADRAGAMASPLQNYRYISRVFMQDEHRGVDYSTAEGTEVYAMDDALVMAAGYHYSWGNYVQLYHGTDADGIQWCTLYAHLSATAAEAGQTVRRGELIGYTGATGQATGQILHLELQLNGHPVDPLYFIEGENGDQLTEETAAELLQLVQGDGAADAVDTLQAAVDSVTAQRAEASACADALQEAIRTGDSDETDKQLYALSDIASWLTDDLYQLEQALFNYDLQSGGHTAADDEAAESARTLLADVQSDLSAYRELVQGMESTRSQAAAVQARQQIDQAQSELDAYLAGQTS